MDSPDKNLARLPRVLVAAPQHESKMYCWDQWWSRVSSLTYRNFDVFISDNSKTMENLGRIKKSHQQGSHFGLYGNWVPWGTNKSLMVHINKSHKQCQDFAIANGYDYMLHLETDVIPPVDVIERLLVHNRAVCCAQYDLFYGLRRKAMIQMIEEHDKTKTGYRITDYLDHREPEFFNGDVKQIYHGGLGCALIHVDILKKIPFRVEAKKPFHTDTYFANDCYTNNVQIFIDTNIQCDHLNSTWLTVKDQF